VFERFTERARQVVMLAQDDARRMKHNYIGTEHLLLGLLREEEGLASTVLRTFGLEVDRVRPEVERMVGIGSEPVEDGQLLFTPRMREVLDLSQREAFSLGHNYIGTEHLLLGLVREGQGVANRVMDEYGASSEAVRDTMIGLLSGKAPAEVAREPAPRRARRSWLDRAAPVYLGGAAMFGVGLFVGWLIWA
jgi:ATP-dependent Clp protease ATP-binding subunit ClpC